MAIQAHPHMPTAGAERACVCGLKHMMPVNADVSANHALDAPISGLSCRQNGLVQTFMLANSELSDSRIITTCLHPGSSMQVLCCIFSSAMSDTKKKGASTSSGRQRMAYVAFGLIVSSYLAVQGSNALLTALAL